MRCQNNLSVAHLLKNCYDTFCKLEMIECMPCIIVHSIFNGLSALSNEAAMTPQRQIISGVLLAVIAGGYALYLALAVKEENIKE